MNNKYMLSSNRYGCLGDCKNCPFFQKNIYHAQNSTLTSNYNKMSYAQYNDYIEGKVLGFWNQMPRTFFWHDNNGVCHTRYEWLQNYLLEYCRKNYPWKMPIYMEVSLGQVVLASDNESYEKNIKNIFKTAIDIASEITKDRNLQASIMLDEIGLVLADDIIEATRKVISILDKIFKDHYGI